MGGGAIIGYLHYVLNKVRVGQEGEAPLKLPHGSGEVGRQGCLHSPSVTALLCHCLWNYLTHTEKEATGMFSREPSEREALRGIYQHTS